MQLLECRVALDIDFDRTVIGEELLDCEAKGVLVCPLSGQIYDLASLSMELEQHTGHSAPPWYWSTGGFGSVARDDDGPCDPPRVVIDAR